MVDKTTLKSKLILVSSVLGSVASFTATDLDDKLALAIEALANDDVLLDFVVRALTMWNGNVDDLIVTIKQKAGL